MRNGARNHSQTNGHTRTLVFLSVVASYAHTNLAAWILRAGVEHVDLPRVSRGLPRAPLRWRWHEVEVSRNDSLPVVLMRLTRFQPAVLAATFYLFNRSFLLALISRFKVLAPQCRVVAGGPEFLGDNRAFMLQFPFIDAVIRGEGEMAFAAWLAGIRRPAAWVTIPGFCGVVNGRYVDNGMAEMMTRLDDIPSPYPAHLKTFHKPFILLETSRGCANQCAFCTSAGIPVRYFSPDRVRRDLRLITAGGVPEVRLVDRTFNDRPIRYLPLLRMFRDDFKSLRFHLEIDPARITPAMLNELAAAEPHRFHIEAGVQTLNPKVLRSLRRQGTVGRVRKGIVQLCRLRNLDVHLDLIAGLPGATLADVLHDLQTLIPLNPSEIQLEILKLLPGTRLDLAARECSPLRQSASPRRVAKASLERSRWRIVAAPEPPYEVLQTSTMSAEDMDAARKLSNLVDWFYNVPELRPVILLAVRLWPHFWEGLIQSGERYLDISHAPSLENRFRWLDAVFRGKKDIGLIHTLHYAWLKHGFSAQHGICPTHAWKEPLPTDAVLVEGDAVESGARRFMAQLEYPTLFIYGHDRCAAAIYRLPSHVVTTI